jgi:hypothetical protein
MVNPASRRATGPVPAAPGPGNRRFKMSRFISVGVIAAMLAATPGFAKDMHCNVNQDYAKAIDGKEVTNDGTKYKMTVKDTFKGVPDSVSSSDYNAFVNIKFGAEKTTSTSLNVQVRPRKSSECLNGVYNHNGTKIWSGAYCDTSNHQKAKSLTLKVMPNTNNALYQAAGAASTTSKVSQFLGIYAKQGSEYVLTGVCVENK